MYKTGFFLFVQGMPPPFAKLHAPLLTTLASRPTPPSSSCRLQRASLYLCSLEFYPSLTILFSVLRSLPLVLLLFFLSSLLALSPSPFVPALPLKARKKGTFPLVAHPGIKNPSKKNPSLPSCTSKQTRENSTRSGRPSWFTLASRTRARRTQACLRVARRKPGRIRPDLDEGRQHRFEIQVVFGGIHACVNCLEAMEISVGCDVQVLMNLR